MKPMTENDFCDLLQAVLRVGVKEALLEFPEAAASKARLARYALAEAMVGEQEAHLQRAVQQVDTIEAELRAALVGQVNHSTLNDR